MYVSVKEQPDVREDVSGGAPVLKAPWAMTVEQAIGVLDSTLDGLTDQEARKRLEQYGPNALPEEPEEGFWQSLKDAFMDPLALVLTGAAVLSAIIGLINGEADNLNQAFLIMGIVVFMVLVGYITDQRAGHELEKLKDLQKTFARVVRGGMIVEVESAKVVVGDVIKLKEGDKVPADAVVTSAHRAEANEALLTGESMPVKKQPGILPADTSLAGRTNMAFAGTYIGSGTITALVSATALATELGNIWEQLRSAEETETPLQRQLDKLGKVLLYGTLIVCFAVVAIYYFRGVGILESLIVAVSLAIAFIPEALGAVITIALALGVREMVSKQAIIKRLRAAEGLGSVQILYTDKTGTITRGHMLVTHVWSLASGAREIGDADNGFLADPDLARLLAIARLCNNEADPTEKALAALATIAGFEMAESLATRRGEVPFSSDRKMMSTAHVVNGRFALHTKGAAERLIERCTTILKGHHVIPLTQDEQAAILAAVQNFEAAGYRVMAFGDKDLQHGTAIDETIERGLTFVGLIALSDPARPEVRETVRLLRGAGIIPAMITGDSPRTALAIAKEVDLVPSSATLSDVVLGAELDELFTDGVETLSSEAVNRIVQARIFARTSPRHKVRIVRALQRTGKLVAMSGDGVNDAPAIKQADVGIAMVGGTEITKETADVVLTGTYAAIAAAVEVGRTILYRTRLYTHALLSTNGCEVLLFIVAALVGWPVPLTAVQLLTINVLGDAWLSIALATEKPEKDVMQRPPRRSTESIITPYMYTSIVLQSVVTTAILCMIFIIAGEFANLQGWDARQTLILQQTAIFCTFITQKVLRSSFTARSLNFNIWQIGFFSNRWSLLAALLTIGMAVSAVHIPVLGMMPLPMELLPYMIGLGLVPPVVEELVKFLRRRM